MAETRVALRHAREGHVVEGTAPNGSRLTFDGESGSAGPTPMQHLLAAAGACALMDVAVILRKKRLDFRDLRVECVGEKPDEGHPRPFVAMRLLFEVDGDVPPKAFDDAVRLAMEKYCNVGATLRAGLVPRFEARVGGASPAPAS